MFLGGGGGYALTKAKHAGVAVECRIVVFVFFGRLCTIALPSTLQTVGDTYSRVVERVVRQGTYTTSALGGKTVYILYFLYSIAIKIAFVYYYYMETYNTYIYILTVSRRLTDYFRSPYSHLLHSLEFVVGSRFSIIRFYILYEPISRHVVVLIVGSCISHNPSVCPSLHSSPSPTTALTYFKENSFSAVAKQIKIV